MANIGFGGGIDPNVGTSIKGTITRKVNGVTIKTDTRGTCGTGTSWPSVDGPYDDSQTYKIELVFDIQFCSGSIDKIDINIYDWSTTAILASKSALVGHTTDFKTTLRLYWNRRNDPNSTPTYLETLDKLDQWSSAQYIPNSGNELNL